ncbi:MAG: hypothetical protein DMG24_20650 [Acidobacteria bacterium]|nr:MAG: hypothetical protein DMG24_20650 [Acidobacteriota bacterium]
MSKISFDPNDEGGLELARIVLLDRLRRDHNWNQISPYDSGFDPYVEYVGPSRPGQERLLTLIQDVFWEFIIQGVLAPGLDLANPNLPWFHITDYGTKVLAASEFLPHDPTGYLRRFRSDIGTPDRTVEAYLSESLNCFERGCFIASVLMLGVASERAFLLVCDSLLAALSKSTERSEFDRILKRNPIKPKQDWVLRKIQEIQKTRPCPLPDNVNVMLTVIFDFIRTQRNSVVTLKRCRQKYLAKTRSST